MNKLKRKIGVQIRLSVTRRSWEKDERKVESMAAGDGVQFHYTK